MSAAVRPPPRPEKPVVALSIKYPNAAGGGVPGTATIAVWNRSERTIKAVRDFTLTR